MLEFEIESCGTASVNELASIHDRYCTTPDYLTRLVSLVKSGRSQIEATWLIKKWLETSRTPDAATSAEILELLVLDADWQAHLHLLQCIRLLDLSQAPVVGLRESVLVKLTSPNKFVRAWAYDGLFRLAQLQHPDAAADLIRISDAAQNESPAVRARIRKLKG